MDLLATPRTNCDTERPGYTWKTVLFATLLVEKLFLCGSSLCITVVTVVTVVTVLLCKNCT